jgi:hypothetical protein
MSLNPAETPELLSQEPLEPGSGGSTIFLKIKLEIDPMGGLPVPWVTAVYAPDPNQLAGGDVDILLWFHGDKTVWSKNRKGHLDLWGKSVEDYLEVNETKLREFILQSSKRKFLLVVPTLNDHTGSGPNRTAGGLLWQQGQAEAFLQQVLNGVREHMGLNVTGIGDIVLAAHSGGGHILGHMAQWFGGQFNKVNEVWCFDCTYWGAEAFITWAKKGHSHPRLWVYSTGGTGPRSTGDEAYEILTFSQSKAAPPGTNIEVLVDNYPKPGRPSSTDGFVATYHGSAGGHYESIEKYLTNLIETSNNLN